MHITVTNINIGMLSSQLNLCTINITSNDALFKQRQAPKASSVSRKRVEQIDDSGYPLSGML